MRLLLDNTGLHRVHVVASTSTDEMISLNDAFALFHFAEHIMFSDGMVVSTFELPQVREESARVIARLASHGCISRSGGDPLLSAEDFSDEEYRIACSEAAPVIQEDLQLLDATAITRAARFADFTTKPLGVTTPRLEKWVARSWPHHERRALADTSILEKAHGAVDFIVANHDPIYRLIQGLDYAQRGRKKIFSLSMVLDVIFRVAINGQLSKLRGCTYAPAPQRANVTHETDHLFRHALERIIQDTAKDGRQENPSRLIQRIISLEQLPLPVFALHFLERKRTGSPMAVLDAARALRDTPEVAELRKWLTKWEALYNVDNLDAQEKAWRELQSIRNFLRPDGEDHNLFSIVRPEFSAGPTGSPEASFDLSGFCGPVARLLARYRRHRNFFAALRRRVHGDRALGARMGGIVGRAIDVGKQ